MLFDLISSILYSVINQINRKDVSQAGGWLDDTIKAKQNRAGIEYKLLVI